MPLDGHANAEGRRFTGKVSGTPSSKRFDLGRTISPLAGAISSQPFDMEGHGERRLKQSQIADVGADRRVLPD